MKWLRAAAAMIAVALSFVWYFDEPLRTTPGFFIDESSIAYNASSIARTGADEHGVRLPVFFEAFGEYKNPVYIYVLAGVFKFVGPGILAARALSIALGFLAAICLSFLVRGMTARAFTFLAAIATPWLFETSRLVFEVAAFPLALGIALLCVLALSRREESLPLLVACAASLALVTYTYTAGRLLGPLLALGLALVVPFRRAVIAWIVYAVLLIPALLNFDALTARLSEVGLAKNFDYLASFTPRFLFIEGDANPRHHIAYGGMLLATVALAALAGLVVTIRAARNDRWSRYLLFAFVIAPLPGALAPEAPHALRLIAVAVVTVIFAGIGVEAMLEVRRDALRFALTAALFLALAAEGLAFRAKHDELGPLRVDDFDAGYPYAFTAALRMQKPPIGVEDSPYYIHAWWYGALHGIDRTQLPRFVEGTEPRGRVCVGSAPVCGACRVVVDVRGFVAYRRE